MNVFDVFNGDADGICALIQLRLDTPKDATLVTGIKRDIKLLEQVNPVQGDEITVLDISLAKNSHDLSRILQAGARVYYVDHHMPGDIPEHPNLTAIIDTDPNTCTSLLVDKQLQGRYREWAVTAAFGDNMISSAEEGARTLSISADDLEKLKLLGVCINYNGYGSCIDDLHFAPQELYKELIRYPSPFDFISDGQSAFEQLRDGYLGDLASARLIKPEFENDAIAVVILPDAPWSRRISGVYGNQLANEFPGRAHAILSYNRQSGYLVSVRAPMNNKRGADELCSSFPSGGGRKGAAGINHLPIDELQTFIKRFSEQYPG